MFLFCASRETMAGSPSADALLAGLRALTAKVAGSDTALYWLASLVSLHMTPTLLVFFALVPAQHVWSGESGRPLGPLDALAVSVLAAAIGLQAVSDQQLADFRRTAYPEGTNLNTASHSKAICRTGMWAYSRHRARRPPAPAPKPMAPALLHPSAPQPHPCAAPRPPSPLRSQLLWRSPLLVRHRLRGLRGRPLSALVPRLERRGRDAPVLPRLRLDDRPAHARDPRPQVCRGDARGQRARADAAARPLVQWVADVLIAAWIAVCFDARSGHRVGCVCASSAHAPSVLEGETREKTEKR